MRANNMLKVASVVLLILFASCSGPSTKTADDSDATPEGIAATVKANSQFAFDMYAKLAEEPGNLFFSPWSISSAFAMVYEGAGLDTAKEIAEVLNFPEEDTVRRSSFAAIHNSLNRDSRDYELRTANALWLFKDYPFNQEFIEIVTKYYASKVAGLDFANEPEVSRETINKWIEAQTNNKIKDLIPKGVLNSMTRLVLTNAVYFKGDWKEEFDKKLTQDEEFRTPQGPVQVPMMKKSDERFNYFESSTLQLLELPYKGDELSMLIILPKNDSLTQAESSLNQIDSWRSQMHPELVRISLPKFKFKTKYFLNDQLKEMGMGLPFSDSADFSKITHAEGLYISDVIHQAYVDVNEEGTEAAAATGIIIRATSMGPGAFKEFRADHPFIFLIKDKENILFMGRVEDPR